MAIQADNADPIYVGCTQRVFQVHKNLATGKMAWFDTEDRRVSEWMETEEACKAWKAPLPFPPSLSQRCGTSFTTLGSMLKG